MAADFGGHLIRFDAIRDRVQGYLEVVNVPDAADRDVFLALEAVQTARVDIKSIRSTFDEVVAADSLVGADTADRRLNVLEIESQMRTMFSDFTVALLKVEEALLDAARSRGTTRVKLLTETGTLQHMAWRETGDWENWRDLYDTDDKQPDPFGDNNVGRAIRIPR